MKPHRLIALVAVAMTLSGCATWSGLRASPVPNTLNAKETAQVKQAVTSLLRDPGSARFDEAMRVTKGGNIVEVCGKVSSRNGYGGSAQPEPFYVSLADGKVTEAEVGSVSSRGAALHTSAEWHCM
jgi:hypothetical protein